MLTLREVRHSQGVAAQVFAIRRAGCSSLGLDFRGVAKCAKPKLKEFGSADLAFVFVHLFHAQTAESTFLFPSVCDCPVSLNHCTSISRQTCCATPLEGSTERVTLTTPSSACRVLPTVADIRATSDSDLLDVGEWRCSQPGRNLSLVG